MGIFDKIQKNFLDKIDTKMNEASDYISKKQEKLNNLDMNEVNNKFLEKFTPKAELFDGDDNLPEKNNKFVCFSCGSNDSICSKKTVHGKICFDCLEKLEEKDIDIKEIKNYSTEQIIALCDDKLTACEIASAFVLKNSPIILDSDEKCYYFGDACGAKIKTITTGYSGARKGTSIRIMKGVSYHIGGSRGQAIREQVLETSPVGTFVVTGKRFVLLTSQYGFEIPGNKILSIEVSDDGFQIYEKNKAHIVITDDVERISLIFKILTDATEEQNRVKELGNDNSLSEKPQVKKRDGKKTEKAFSGADEIRKYKELMDDGIITKEEFEKKKSDILGF